MYRSNTPRSITTQFLIAILLTGTLFNAAFAQSRLSDVPLTKGDVETSDAPLSKGDFEPGIMPPCTGGEFKTTGNSSETGTAGNIRPFSVGTINVRVSASARRNSDGVWQDAFLGAFSPGLGVTDSSESGSGDTHKVDNVGTFKNYVLYEFSQPVVVDRASIESISGDSDITVWIGNAVDPYNNHITLSDARLALYGPENNNASGTSARWADFNASGEVGNVLIIAARADHSDDAFKLEALDISCPPPPCAESKLETTGDSAGDGTDGNIRTFTSGSISVRTSAFAKRNSDGGWETAFLGAFSPGLGVTDQGEGNGDADRHKVDNIGNRKNYVLYEFNQDVVVDRVYLDSVGDDSDITVWVGSATDPFINHLSLGDGALAHLGASEDNDTGVSGSRWADINASQRVGNLLIVAASTSDATPEDAFKIGALEVSCADNSNRAKVTIIQEVITATGSTFSPQLFDFGASAFGLINFDLADLNTIGPDRVLNANILAFGAANPIAVTQSLTPSWTLANLACAETGGINNTTFNLLTRQATIIAEPGESIVCIFVNTQLIPSAAHSSISGRAVTADGWGISGATLTLTDIVSGQTKIARTNPFGYYRIDDVEVGLFYVLTISHKRHSFIEDTRTFTLVDELVSVDFMEAF